MAALGTIATNGNDAKKMPLVRRDCPPTISVHRPRPLTPIAVWRWTITGGTIAPTPRFVSTIRAPRTDVTVLLVQTHHLPWRGRRLGRRGGRLGRRRLRWCGCLRRCGRLRWCGHRRWARNEGPTG